MSIQCPSRLVSCEQKPAPPDGIKKETDHFDNFERTDMSEVGRKIDKIREAIDSGKIINDRLEVMNKGGFRRVYWCVLTLLSPFYRLFGKDAFSHVRINRVAEKLLEYCKQNVHDFKDTCHKNNSSSNEINNYAEIPKKLLVIKNKLVPFFKKKSKDKKSIGLETFSELIYFSNPT